VASDTRCLFHRSTAPKVTDMNRSFALLLSLSVASVSFAARPVEKNATKPREHAPKTHKQVAPRGPLKPRSFETAPTK
jgi:hypothetical protein